MKIDLNASEIWDLLKEGSSNQRYFIECLEYGEFIEFIEFIESMEDYDEFDLLGYLNGGVLSVEDDPVKDYVIWENERISIVLL